MGAHETRTFKSGNSEAVRLPKGMGFGIDRAVTVERTGDTLTIRPTVDRERERAEIDRFLADMAAIGRPEAIQDRESVRLEFPERPGL